MFFERANLLCNIKKLKLTKVVTELGYSTGNIARWKKGTEPSGDIIVNFADFFDVSADYLLGLTDNPKRAENNFTYEEIEIIEAYRENVDIQNAIKRLLKIPEEREIKREQENQRRIAK